VDPAGRKALARSGPAQRDGSSRHPRAPQWRARGLAWARHRRAVRVHTGLI